MPHFYFNLARDGVFLADEDGLVFPSLDEAYLEACRAALDISFEMLRHRQDPNDHRFEIADQSGTIVMEIPFSEVLHPGRAPQRVFDPRKMREVFEKGLSRHRALRVDLADQILAATRNVHETRLLLARSRSTAGQNA